MRWAELFAAGHSPSSGVNGADAADGVAQAPVNSPEVDLSLSCSRGFQGSGFMSLAKYCAEKTRPLALEVPTLPAE